MFKCSNNSLRITITNNHNFIRVKAILRLAAFIRTYIITPCLNAKVPCDFVLIFQFQNCVKHSPRRATFPPPTNRPAQLTFPVGDFAPFRNSFAKHTNTHKWCYIEQNDCKRLLLGHPNRCVLLARNWVFRESVLKESKGTARYSSLTLSLYVSLFLCVFGKAVGEWVAKRAPRCEGGQDAVDGACTFRPFSITNNSVVFTSPCAGASAIAP